MFEGHYLDCGQSIGVPRTISLNDWIRLTCGQAKRAHDGKPTGWVDRMLKRWAELVAKRKTTRQQASEILAKRDERD